MTNLQDLVATIQPGDLVVIPPDYSGVAMAATAALAAAGVTGLRLLAAPTSGLQADVLIGAGAVAELEAAAISLGESGLAPRFTAAIKAGSLLMRDTTCPAVHAALQASEKGLPFMPLRGLLGSDVQRHRADWIVTDNPFQLGDPLVLLPAIKPDVALFHAARADRQGNVWVGRRRELITMAHAAKRTLVTVEEIVEGSLLSDEVTAAGVLPGLYVSEIALAPQGAWPLGLLDLYGTDDQALVDYASAAKTSAGFAAWLPTLLQRHGLSR